MKARPESLDESIDAAPEAPQKKALRNARVHFVKRRREPKKDCSGECLFSYQRILLVFAAHKGHSGFYPRPSTVKSSSH